MLNVELVSEDKLISHLKNSKIPTLFVVEHSTQIHYSSELVSSFKFPDAYTNMFFFANRHPVFGATLKKALCPNFQPKKINIPSNAISVAVHVRKGSGNDTELACVQYMDELVQLIENQIKKPDVSTIATDQHFPLKLPPEQFYVDQIMRLSQFLKNPPMFVYIFTDGKQPKDIIERFKQRINYPNITFACEEQDAKGRHADHNSIIEDVYNMSRFDCLIKPESGFALSAQLIGSHKIIIYPQTGNLLGSPQLNQYFFATDDVSIIYNNPYTGAAEFSSFNTPTEDDQRQAFQYLAFELLGAKIA